MLILTRKPSQSLSIHPQPTLDPHTPVEQLFEAGPIRVQVLGVQGSQVRLGVVAHAGLSILRAELWPPAVVGPLTEGARLVLARKLKLLMFLNRHTTHSLATATALEPARVCAAERGAGALAPDDLEKMARVLEVKVAELFIPPGRTAMERVVLALLEGEC
jgi:sRNA-binding carbon storage regulator CsrA